MTPDRALRLAAEPVPLPERRLELIPALSTASRIARDHGIASQAHGGAGSHELRLPGIGGRSSRRDRHPCGSPGLARRRRRRAGRGVGRPMRDVDRVLVRCGSRPSGPGARRAARRAGRLRPVSVAAGGATSGSPAADTVADLMRAGIARGAVCAAAESAGCRRRAMCGQPPRAERTRHPWNGGWRERWTHVGTQLLVAPSIPSGSLVGLREQVAAAPRCGWCRAPLVGSICRRCAPAIRT